jgi:hypothetical protein
VQVCRHIAYYLLLPPIQDTWLHFSFPSQSFGCVLHINGPPCKVPLPAKDRNNDFLYLEWCWGQERLCLTVRSLPTLSMIILCFLGCCSRNAIVGAKKVATNVAPKLFCNANMFGQCWWACPNLSLTCYFPVPTNCLFGITLLLVWNDCCSLMWHHLMCSFSHLEATFFQVYSGWWVN